MRGLVLLLASAAFAVAGLRWETTEITGEAAHGQERFEGTFAFVNEGDKPATITRISTSCGCTTAKLPKNTYAPGERGEIHVEFEFGDRAGLQQKTISVYTEDAPDRSTELYLRVLIPEAVNMDRRLLQWGVGQPAEPAEVLLRVAEGAPVVFSEVTSDNPGFTIRSEELPDKAGLRLIIVPESTLAAVRTAVRVHAKVAGAPRIYSIYALVR